MFGWEFPPHIAGGLGTACYGMTRGLARNGVDVTFIVPHAYGDEDQRFTHVVNASDVEALYGSTGSGADDILEKMSFIHIDSNMVPYISPEEYESYHEQYVKSGRKTWSTTDAWKQRYTFSGKYGANLMEEVARYAVVAAQVARDLEGQFDVIHAHDWLTYYAGIAAKRVSGKPLVVHMHATEYDRSGENVNTQVYAIERAGMHAADRVIAVSNLTRNIVINRYGIPAGKVDKVFERFMKLDAKKQGTGLGLSISRTIIKKLGGEIGVFSEYGKGSTFWFTLPVKPFDFLPLQQRTEDVSETVEFNETEYDAGAVRRTILIAEDMDDNYLLYKIYLEKHYDLIRATNGEEAVSKYLECNPDIILMDIGMPVVDGYQATDAIRQLSSDIPIVAVTAFAYDEDRRKVMSRGFNGYLSKPLNKDELLKMLHKMGI